MNTKSPHLKSLQNPLCLLTLMAAFGSANAVTVLPVGVATWYSPTGNVLSQTQVDMQLLSEVGADQTNIAVTGGIFFGQAWDGTLTLNGTLTSGFSGSMLYDSFGFTNIPVTFDFLNTPAPSFWGYEGILERPHKITTLDGDIDGILGNVISGGPHAGSSMALSFCVGGTPEDSCSYEYLTAVPVPATVWLFGTGLLGLIGVARRKQTH